MSTTGKKTVHVVKRLCKGFVGTHQSIFVNRFYTSIDLMQELESINLYITGTMMANWIPKLLTIAKESNSMKWKEGSSRNTYMCTRTKVESRRLAVLFVGRTATWFIALQTKSIPLKLDTAIGGCKVVGSALNAQRQLNVITATWAELTLLI